MALIETRRPRSAYEEGLFGEGDEIEIRGSEEIEGHMSDAWHSAKQNWAWILGGAAGFWGLSKLAPKAKRMWKGRR